MNTDKKNFNINPNQIQKPQPWENILLFPQNDINIAINNSQQ